MTLEINTLVSRQDYINDLIQNIAQKYSICHYDVMCNTIFLETHDDDVVLYATPEFNYYEVDQNESTKNHIDTCSVNDEGVTLNSHSISFVYTFDLETDTQNYITKMNEYLKSLHYEW